MPPDGDPSKAGARLASLAGLVGGRTFSLKEVAQHNTPGDCWLVMRGKVYDVTEWCVVCALLRGRGRAPAERRPAGHVGACRRVPQHPGGPLIYVAAGKDCTQLFDAYHPLRVRRVWSASWRAARSRLRACAARANCSLRPACAAACCPSTASAT